MPSSTQMILQTTHAGSMPAGTHKQKRSAKRATHPNSAEC